MKLELFQMDPDTLLSEGHRLMRTTKACKKPKFFEAEHSFAEAARRFTQQGKHVQASATWRLAAECAIAASEGTGRAAAYYISAASPIGGAISEMERASLYEQAAALYANSGEMHSASLTYIRASKCNAASIVDGATSSDIEYAYKKRVALLECSVDAAGSCDMGARDSDANVYLVDPLNCLLEQHVRFATDSSDAIRITQRLDRVYSSLGQSYNVHRNVLVRLILQLRAGDVVAASAALQTVMSESDTFSQSDTASASEAIMEAFTNMDADALHAAVRTSTVNYFPRYIAEVARGLVISRSM